LGGGASAAIHPKAIHLSLTKTLRPSVAGATIVDGGELMQNTAMIIQILSLRLSFEVLEGKGA
jgi:hypothetical protein